MSNSKIPFDLQKLWEELNQDETERYEQDLQKRLELRAEQYAIQAEASVSYSEDEIVRVLSFRLGKERYAVDVAIVRGVRTIHKITRVPAAPIFYQGVVNIRGQIISVLDLRLFFGMRADELDKQELILIETADLFIGLLAEHIEEVQTIPLNSIASGHVNYARGVTKEQIIILDTDILLSDERLIVGGEKAHDESN
jgi:purine-binding chemotaxis protein CheW